MLCLNGFYSLKGIAEILSVSEERVVDFIEHGALVARVDDGRRLVHEEDLRAFRRPLAIASCATNRPQTVATCSAPSTREVPKASPTEVYITLSSPLKRTSTSFPPEEENATNAANEGNPDPSAGVSSWERSRPVLRLVRP